MASVRLPIHIHTTPTHVRFSFAYSIPHSSPSRSRHSLSCTDKWCSRLQRNSIIQLFFFNTLGYMQKGARVREKNLSQIPRACSDFNSNLSMRTKEGGREKRNLTRAIECVRDFRTNLASNQSTSYLCGLISIFIPNVVSIWYIAVIWVGEKEIFTLINDVDVSLTQYIFFFIFCVLHFWSHWRQRRVRKMMTKIEGVKLFKLQTFHPI